MAVRLHVHEPLVGTVLIANEQVFKTKLAQVYPPALCRAWAGLIARRPQAADRPGPALEATQAADHCGESFRRRVSAQARGIASAASSRDGARSGSESGSRSPPPFHHRARA